MPNASQTGHPAKDWTLLEGLSVDIHESGKFIDRGRVEAATNDGCILWLAQEGVHPRRLVEKLPGTELRIIPALEKTLARGAGQLMNSVLMTSREWLWAVDEQGIFTFSSPTSARLLGFSPEELVGQPSSTVIGPEDLATARRAVQAPAGSGRPGWRGVLIRCRHRDGSAVWMETSGQVRYGRDGQRSGVEPTSRPVPPQTAQEAAANHSRTRIRELIDSKGLQTAFQPIHDLPSGELLGFEALCRFPNDDTGDTQYWFGEAATVGLTAELEFAALTTALQTAQWLPSHVYLALNISPATCLDPRLPGILERSTVPMDRIVLELTERLEVTDYGPLNSALQPLRRAGLRIAVDDAGSGFATMRHVLQIRPDIIKLDRSLVTGIDDDHGQRALGGALAEFARQIGATLVAEGIETHQELATVTLIGITAGQGHLLGRPTTHPPE